MKIKTIRIFKPPNKNPSFNQSDMVVEILTDEGLTGIGEGGSKDFLEQCAGMIIGEDPGRIYHLWQMMARGYFYPAGREKLHAMGALDLALWDMKGKKLGVPLFELFGGLTRNHVECYSTGYPWKGSSGETALACIESGFRAYRTSVADPKDGIFDSRRMVEKTLETCIEIRRGIGKTGDWAIDYHTRLDFADAVRLSRLIEELSPLFIEDPLRSENKETLLSFRQQVHLPIAVGEQYGDRWDINSLIERHAIDFSRMTLPNTGGITEFIKIASIAETHQVGLVPHFTGPIALSALVNVLCTLSVPVLMEVLGTGPTLPPYLTAGVIFNNGKLWPSSHPGLGVELDHSKLELLSEVDTFYRPIPLFQRPDGSYTNW